MRLGVPELLVILVIYVTMVYGPIAAWLVELFPTRIRYSGLSLPYHIGNGWFGGMLPLTATAMVAASGDIYYGFWYSIVVAVMSLVIGVLFLKDNKDIYARIEGDLKKELGLTKLPEVAAPQPAAPEQKAAATATVSKGASEGRPVAMKR